MLRRPMPATHDGLTVALRYEAWKRFFGTRVKRMLVPAFIVWRPLNHDRSLTKFCVGVCAGIGERRADAVVRRDEPERRVVAVGQAGVVLVDLREAVAEAVGQRRRQHRVVADRAAPVVEQPLAQRRAAFKLRSRIWLVTINTAPQFETEDPLRKRLFNNWGGAFGYDAVLSPPMTNSFRYGFTKIDENNAGLTNGNYTIRSVISPYEGIGIIFHGYPANPDPELRQRSVVVQGCLHDESGHEHPVHSRAQEPIPVLGLDRHLESVVGSRNRPSAMPGSSSARLPAATSLRWRQLSEPFMPTRGYTSSGAVAGDAAREL